ncbi:RNA polymerase sigma factor [Microbacterium gorillae]|uniref:RNA polymerase sigma factor n=1 Tax=Microbacterium gorillae TaxID=1231063 RepID=UPI00058F95BF|nr:sigma-70 family RNA polymerase sigma factor [Microbacterium gorillae]
MPKAGADHLTGVLRANALDVLRYLQRRVGLDDAADLLSETMMIAWRRVTDLPGEDVAARMWMFGIARGTLLNHARGERRRVALADRVRHEARAATAPPSDTGTEVRDAIARLDPDLAELVRLVHWDGFSVAQAAELLGIPAPTARGRYARAKEQLRAALTETVPGGASRG